MDNDGFETVTLTSENSHTHRQGDQLVKWEWYDERRDVGIGEEGSVTVRLPVGKNGIVLTVTDGGGSEGVVREVIEVKSGSVDGFWCYFYGDDDEIVYGDGFESLRFDEESWPKDLRGVQGKGGRVRCIGDFLVVQDGTFVFYVGKGSGEVGITFDGVKREDVDEVVGSNGGINKIGPVDLEKGKVKMVVDYKVEDLKEAVLKLTVVLEDKVVFVENGLVSYDAGKILPTVHDMDPKSENLEGGGSVKITGSAFRMVDKVLFGEVEAKNVKIVNDGEITATIPAAGEDVEKVEVKVVTGAGSSNGFPFTYSSKGPVAIKFKQGNLVDEAGEEYKIDGVASIAIGPDFRYYLGALDGHVYAIPVNHDTLAVDTGKVCKSENLGEKRWVTSIAFNPSESGIKVYASTNVMYWNGQGNNDPGLDLSEKPWNNGKVSYLMPSSDGECLKYFGDILTGLPVSNHDHGVNSIVFDTNGKDMYVAIGGTTNAGVSKLGDWIGGVPDSPLSGSMIVAHLKAPGFDGDVTYDNIASPGVAKKTSPDEFVEVYAFGLRNSYGTTLHSNGAIYSTDNGANPGYGVVSTSCDTNGEEPQKAEDALLKIEKGGYYGYPSRNRGVGMDDPRQCTYYAPGTASTDGYTEALALFPSSTNGIIEYTANTFGAQMKGDLILTKFVPNNADANGQAFRQTLDEKGNPAKEYTELAQLSGLSIAMNPQGHLIMPQVQKNRIVTLIADESEPAGDAPYVISVTPRRGTPFGGNTLLITGYRLSADSATVTVGGKVCKVTSVSDDARYIKCTAPAGEGKAAVQVTTSAGVSESFGEDYQYQES